MKNVYMKVYYFRNIRNGFALMPVFGVFLVRMRENTDQRNPEYGHFSRRDCLDATIK